jgi:hypothetical protein
VWQQPLISNTLEEVIDFHLHSRGKSENILKISENGVFMERSMKTARPVIPPTIASDCPWALNNTDNLFETSTFVWNER